MRIDPITGDRDISAKFSFVDAIAIEADGHIIGVDQRNEAIIQIDPIHGNRTTVSDASTGSGPLWQDPTGLAVEATGQFVVTDAKLHALIRVDPHTGDRAIISR